MSKIILEFDGVEEEREAQYALDGFKYSMVIDYILQDLRQVVKHSASLVKRGEFATNEEIEVCNAIRERLYSYLQDYNISATE